MATTIEPTPHGPQVTLPDFTDEEAIQFLKNPGSILCRQPEEGKSIYDPTIKSLAIIQREDLPEEFEEEYEISSDEVYLIEHLATGFCYIVCQMEAEYYEAKGRPVPYEPIPLVSFSGTKENPADFIISLLDAHPVPTGLDTLGTRIGGKPMNSDGTEYQGLWPHTGGQPLPFIAQYELSDGRYVHVFADRSRKWYGEIDWREETGSDTCAIIEGGEIPHWVEMKFIDAPLLDHPTRAFKPVTLSEIPVAPQWIQWDDTPNDAGMIFLGQIGTGTLGYDDEFMFGDSGDIYIFANPATGRARVTGQCC